MTEHIATASAESGDSTVVALSEWESKQRLGSGLPMPRERLTASASNAVTACADFGGRVVLKSSGVAHKSELGLVRVGLDADAVAAAWQHLADAGDGTVLCAEMVSGELELIVGGLRDPHFGPVVSIGIGGVATEVLADIATVLAPPEPGEVEVALAGLKGAALLAGHRGKPAVDMVGLNAVVDAVARLLDADPAVVEIDCNPVAICNGVPMVLDALVVIDTALR